jgi:hypothetical protein
MGYIGGYGGAMLVVVVLVGMGVGGADMVGLLALYTNELYI